MPRCHVHGTHQPTAVRIQHTNALTLAPTIHGHSEKKDNDKDTKQDPHERGDVVVVGPAVRR